MVQVLARLLTSSFVTLIGQYIVHLYKYPPCCLVPLGHSPSPTPEKWYFYDVELEDSYLDVFGQLTVQELKKKRIV